MHIARRGTDDCLVLEFGGALTVGAAPTVRDAVLKAVADAPRAVVCDLSGVEYVSAGGGSVFFLIGDLHASWPDVPICLAAAPDHVSRRLQRMGVDRRFPTFPSLPLALAGAQAVPMPAMYRLRLPPTVEAARLARKFVTRRGEQHEVPHPLADIGVVVHELAANAVVHARTDFEVKVSISGHAFRVSVRDGSYQQPLIRVSSHTDPGGRGLLLVDRLSRSWGVLPTIRPGKVVWARW